MAIKLLLLRLSAHQYLTCRPDLSGLQREWSIATKRAIRSRIPVSRWFALLQRNRPHPRQVSRQRGLAEIAIPLLKDLPFAKQLSFEPPVAWKLFNRRHTNQWRLAMEWAPVSDVRFRRARPTPCVHPTLRSCMAHRARISTAAANDPCDKDQVKGIAAGDTARRATRIANCAAAIPGYNPATLFPTSEPQTSLQLLQGGNPDLGSEVARTYTAGFVVQPHWLKGLEFSTDYWQINVDGAISTIPIKHAAAEPLL